MFPNLSLILSAAHFSPEVHVAEKQAVTHLAKVGRGNSDT